MGRKTKLLNTNTYNTILKYISNGNYIKTACLAANVHPATYCNWQQWANEYANSPGNGNEHKKIYHEFFEDLKNAEAKAEVSIVEDIHKASKHPQYWAAGMTMLERRHKDRWGKEPEIVVENKTLIAIQELARQSRIESQEVKQLEQGGGGGDSTE